MYVHLFVYIPTYICTYRFIQLLTERLDCRRSTRFKSVCICKLNEYERNCRRTFLKTLLHLNILNFLIHLIGKVLQIHKLTDSTTLSVSHKHTLCFMIKRTHTLKVTCTHSAIPTTCIHIFSFVDT